MKVWEMIETGKIGDRFKCVSNVSTWNNSVFEFTKTTYGGHCIQESNGSLQLLEMCGAAIEADWIKLPKVVVEVGFHEAYKAFMSGSQIQSMESGRIFENNDYAIAFSVDVINGKWIILDK